MLRPVPLLLSAVAGLACAGPAPVSPPPGQAEAPEVYAETRPIMSTLVTVTVAAAPRGKATAAAEAAFAAFTHVEEVMNEWRPASPLSSLNVAAGSGRWVEMPGDLCQVLRIGRDGARRTGGLFDPTWAALRGLWRFGEAEVPSVPPPEMIAARCPLVAWRDLELEPAPGSAAGPCRARLARHGMQVGLGGLAKGWAVDRAVAELRRRGLSDFVVQAGGDLYAAGGHGGRPWTVGVRDPRGPPDEAFAWLDVSDRAFSTSGDYERFFVVDGVRHHHILDPRTCRPAEASRSASVLAASAVEAEILGKAVFILGGEAGLRLAEQEGAAALLVTSANRVMASPALQARVRLERAPSP